ncbi:hypothetical protein JW877_08045 [bacterium]|nr:hypothetical protein [bacterium]
MAKQSALTGVVRARTEGYQHLKPFDAIDVFSLKRDSDAAYPNIDYYSMKK